MLRCLHERPDKQKRREEPRLVENLPYLLTHRVGELDVDGADRRGSSFLHFLP